MLIYVFGFWLGLDINKVVRMDYLVYKLRW